jgi:hypothetical protein
VTRAELDHLLASPEDTWLDWKKEFHQGLEEPRSSEQHHQARGKLLKDLPQSLNWNLVIRTGRWI